VTLYLVALPPDLDELLSGGREIRAVHCGQPDENKDGGYGGSWLKEYKLV
jgi:hypothetical protein